MEDKMTGIGNKVVDGVELKEEERQKCEVWTRVMGYYRPTSFFNIGKQGEHEERVHFEEKSTCRGICK